MIGHITCTNMLQSHHVSQYARSHHVHQYATQPHHVSRQLVWCIVLSGSCMVLSTLHNRLKLLNQTEGQPKDRSAWNMPQRLHISKLTITIDNNICNCFGEVYNYKLHSKTVFAAMGNVRIPRDNFRNENKPTNPTAAEII